MSKSLSLISALLCTFIWGTTFIAQDTGMDKIGPLTFNGARFFIGFLSIIPIALIYENSKIIKQINNNKTEFFKLLFWIGLFLFLGTFVQQAALLYTDIANAAFFTVFYVPMVPIILYIFYKKKIHWSIWPCAILCVAGVYLLSDFSDATVRFGDSLVILCAFFWALHIIFAGKFMETFDIPIFYAALQGALVTILSVISSYIFEDIIISNILLESVFTVFHLRKLFFVIRAFSNIRGIFSSLIFKIKFGQISESTNEAISGFQFLKKLLTKNLKSYGKN